MRNTYLHGTTAVISYEGLKPKQSARLTLLPQGTTAVISYEGLKLDVPFEVTLQGCGTTAVISYEGLKHIFDDHIKLINQWYNGRDFL